MLSISHNLSTPFEIEMTSCQLSPCEKKRIQNLPPHLKVLITKYVFEEIFFSPRCFFTHLSIPNLVDVFSHQLGRNFTYLSNCSTFHEVQLVFLGESHGNAADYDMKNQFCSSLVENGETVWIESAPENLKKNAAIHFLHFNPLERIELKGWDCAIPDIEKLFFPILFLGKFNQRLFEWEKKQYHIDAFLQNLERFCVEYLSLLGNEDLKDYKEDLQVVLQGDYLPFERSWITCFLLSAYFYYKVDSVIEREWRRRQESLRKAIQQQVHSGKRGFFLGGKAHFIHQGEIEPNILKDVKNVKYLMIYQETMVENSKDLLSPFVYEDFLNLPRILDFSRLYMLFGKTIVELYDQIFNFDPKFHDKLERLHLSITLS